VTPIYNEAEFLAECIESVLAQTYSNWEYTIVDNCSTDRSVEIARRYAAKDKRIRVTVNSRFVRAVQNFNGALNQISPSSKYCKVLLGDDWIFPECMERLVEVAERHPSVGIVGAFALEGSQVKWTGLPYPNEIISGREICRKHLLENLYVFGTPTTLLYRADLVRANNPFYNEANFNADTEVCFALLRNCDFGFVHQVLTFTRLRPGSLTSVSTSLQTNLPGDLHILSTYGAYYLEPEELESNLRKHVSRYYQYLGRSLMHFRDRKFWNYHKAKLNKCGVGFSWMRVTRGGVEALWASRCNPIHSISNGWKAFKKSRTLTRRSESSGANAHVEIAGR
jgi:glycosyltransferase involved in cell wall biosynthesis